MNDYCKKRCKKRPKGQKENYGYVELFEAIGMGVIGVALAMIMVLIAVVFDL